MPGRETESLGQLKIGTGNDMVKIDIENCPFFLLKIDHITILVSWFLGMTYYTQHTRA